MDGDRYVIKESLKIVAKKIEKIESEDPDYQTNEKWIELRSQQDKLFYIKKKLDAEKTEEKKNA